MRNSILPQTLDEFFCKSVEKVPTEYLNDLRSNVIDSSNFQNLTFFRMSGLKLQERLELAIISWYLPEEIGFVIREDLHDSQRLLSLDDQLLIEIVCSSKAEMLIWLTETSLWHTRDFFGNWPKDIHGKLRRLLKISPLHRKVKRVQRKRGYDDHGSRVEDHRWLPKFDYTLTEKHRELEQRRQTAKDTFSFIQGMLW